MVQDSPSRKQDQYIVRFPDGMRDTLKEAAAENGRSLNAEIVQRLEASIEGQEGTSALANQAFIQGMLIAFSTAVLDAKDPVAELKDYRARVVHQSQSEATQRLISGLEKTFRENPLSSARHARGPTPTELAYEAGRAAFLEGLSDEVENPYADGTDEADFFVQGVEDEAAKGTMEDDD